MLDGMAKSLALQHVKEYQQQVLPGVPEARALKRMRPDLLPFQRLEGAGPLDSLEHASERRMCKVHVVEVGFSLHDQVPRKTCSTSAADYPSQGGRLRGCRAAFAQLWQHRGNVSSDSNI